jgi:hypothetical protein
MKQHEKLFQEMITTHKELFGRFKLLNDEYAVNPDQVKADFNKVGEAVLAVIRTYENRLCSSTERSQYNKFSGGLAEKFWADIRTLFNKIDFIGVE